MDVPEYYKGVYAECESVLNKAIADEEVVKEQTAALNYLNDLHQWTTILKERYECEVLEGAIREYQFSLFALMLGQYRQSFSALRLFFELSLATVHFSANEFHFREWKSDQRDIKWQVLVDADNGVLSQKFTNAFFPSLGDSTRHFRGLAERAYRECSEYVHGNATTHKTLPKGIDYSKDIFVTWHEKAEVIRLVVTYSFVNRYLEFLGSADLQLIEPAILERLGHLQPIQSKF